MKISKNLRLHFYTPELPAIVHEEDVHNHRYDFTSYVLKGVLRQTFYREILGTTHLKEYENCQQTPDPNTPPPIECSIQPYSHHVYSVGSQYSILHDVFHNVSPKNECITLLDRGDYKKPFAEVIRKAESAKVCPFSKEIPQEELWDIVSGIMSGVRQFV